MGFWGIEVEPGKPYSYISESAPARLHVTQATLGSGPSKDKSILQCSKGDKNPIYLCSLLPCKNECCPLNLEFVDDEETVIFSVIGSRSIHLSGFLETDDGDIMQDGYDSGSEEGIDIAETDSGESSEYDSEDDNDEDEEDDSFIDDEDLMVFPPSPVRNSSVVIEEIEDEEEPGKEAKPKAKKKNKSGDNENAKKQIVAKGSGQTAILESEDEDGFPITKRENDDVDNVSGKKRKVNSTEQDDKIESPAIAYLNFQNSNSFKDSFPDNATVHLTKQTYFSEAKKKKKKQKEKSKVGIANESKDESHGQVEKENLIVEEKTPDQNQNENEGTPNNAKNVEIVDSTVADDKSSEKKKKNKKKKNKKQDVEAAATDKTATDEKAALDMEEDQFKSKSSQMRTYPNGLVVEELSMGKPNGKRASPGKQVSVRYIGKLKKNDKIFDSNIRGPPFKFRLGLGQVIKGWDVGVNGMRVGDKRRLTIPPAMGYGTRGAGGAIPPNAWLLFDVELVDVR